jgi:hypothetical protein
VALEHALWGNFLFTTGIGWYFYSGSITWNDLYRPKTSGRILPHLKGHFCCHYQYRNELTPRNWKVSSNWMKC